MDQPVGSQPGLGAHVCLSDVHFSGPWQLDSGLALILCGRQQSTY